MVDKVEVKAEARQRSKRVPFGVPRNKLAVNNLIEGYHLRWINDEAGRIFQAQQGGYDFVTPSEVGLPPTPDDKVSVLAGSKKDGSALNTYLMKIAMEYYLEDKASHESQIDKIDTAIRGGKADDADKTGRYIPSTGISMKQK